MSSEAPDTQRHADDLSLARRVLVGDGQACQEILQRLECVPAVLRERHRRMGSPLSSEELEDVQQDALMEMWVKLREFRGQAALETWAYRFVTNELLAAVDRKLRRARITSRDESQDPDTQPAAGPDSDSPSLDRSVLHLALSRLSEAVAEVIRARHFDERSFEEIARDSHTPVSTIKARYYRGLCDLKRLIAPHWRNVAP